MVAQTQKLLFLGNCCSTTRMLSLNHKNCCSGTTGRPKEAEWRQNHCQSGSMVAVVAEWRHSDRSMDAIGRPKEAQWWYKGGRSIAQIDTQCLQQHAFLRGDQWPTPVHPFCDPAMHVPSSCLFWATCERPTSSATFVRLFWACSKLHGTMAFMARSERPLCHPWTTKATFRPPSVPLTATWPVLWSHKRGTEVPASVKGSITCY